MPKMPVYNSQGSLNTGLSAPIKEGSAQEATATAPIVDTVSQIHDKWNQAVDTMQYTSAKASFETGMMDILNRASQDPDYNGSDKYFKEIGKLKTNVLDGITNKQLQERMGFEFGVETDNTKIKVANIFNKKKLEFSLGELSRGIDALEQRRLNAVTIQEAQKIDQDITNLIQSNVSAGIITPEQGYKKQKEAKINAVDFTIESNPEFALQELNNPDGLFKDVPADIKIRKIKQAQDKVNQLYDKTRDERQTNALDLTLSGALTQEFIDNESKIPYEKGGLRPSTLRDLKRAYNRQQEADLKIIVKNNENAKKFIDLVDKSIANKIDAQTTKDYLISAYADKVLSADEAKKINDLQNIMRQMEANHSKDSSRLPNAIKKVRYWFDRNNPSTEDLSKSLKQLLMSPDINNNPEESASQVVRNNRLQKYPWMANLPKDGEIRTCPDGVSRRFYPDGRIEDVK